METMPLWLQIAGYMTPLVISIASATFIYLKDKSTIKKTGAETNEIDVHSDRQDSKLSLDWALQFKTRMDNLEALHIEDRNQIVLLQEQIYKLTALNFTDNQRINKLEKERDELLNEMVGLRNRIRELECENKTLKFPAKED